MVITFLPYASFAKSARCLDTRRLGKQRAEAKGIYNVLTDPTTKGNKYIPQIIMWEGCEQWLLAYTYSVCFEWIDRGYQDNIMDWCLMKMGPGPIKDQHYLICDQPETMPTWLGAPGLHASHRSRLVAKKWEHYCAKLGWRDRPGEYFWPGSSKQFATNYGESDLYTTIKALQTMSLLAKQSQDQLQLLLSPCL